VPCLILQRRLAKLDEFGATARKGKIVQVNICTVIGILILDPPHLFCISALFRGHLRPLGTTGYTKLFRLLFQC